MSCEKFVGFTSDDRFSVRLFCYDENRRHRSIMARKNLFTIVFSFLFVVALVTLVQLDLITKYWDRNGANNTANNNPVIRDNRAFATIITPNEKDLALAMAQNFIDKKSRYPFLILIIDHYSNVTISEDYIRRAKMLNAKPIILEKAPVAPTVKIRNDNYKIAWNKLSAWKQLVEYTKIALLDVDMLVLHNVDELLDMPDISFVMGTCKPCEEPWGLNGGLLVFEPSLVTYEKFMNLSQEHSKDNWQQSEQQLIKTFYMTREPEKMHVLSRIYNANVNSCSCMPKNAWEFMKILHWMCDGTTGKPYQWTKSKIHDELFKIKDTNPQKKCVHGYNLKWLEYYQTALAYTDPKE